jgi:hypothetical protein
MLKKALVFLEATEHEIPRVESLIGRLVELIRSTQITISFAYSHMFGRDVLTASSIAWRLVGFRKIGSMIVARLRLRLAC